MGCSSDDRSSSFTVALEAGQSDVVMGVPLRIVHAVNAILLGVFGLVGPQELDIAGSTSVVLGLSEMQDAVDSKVELMSFGSVLAHVCCEFALDALAEFLPGKLSYLLFFWGTADPL